MRRALTALLLAAPLAAQEPFPTRPPGPTALRPAQFPPFQEVALPNGMTLLLIENHEQPSLSATLSFRAGNAYDPVGKEGLSAMVAELLTKGTPTRSADQIAATIEGVGGSLSASASDDFLTVSADVLSDHAALAFELLGDVTRRATFAPDELELARTRGLSALEVELSQPDAVATTWAIWRGVSIVSGNDPTRNPFVAASSLSGIASVRMRSIWRSISVRALSVTAVRPSNVACQLPSPRLRCSAA